MNLVIITALGVGGATIFGAIIGMCFKKIPHEWNDAILGFAAGIMMAAAMLGLIMPAVEITGASGIWQVVIGIDVYKRQSFSSPVGVADQWLHALRKSGKDRQNN